MPELGHSSDKLDILCLPARDDADAIAAFGLCQLLDREGFCSSSARPGTTQEAVARVSQDMPDVVCISDMPPFALGHTKALYATLRPQFPQLAIVVCYWQFDGDLARISNRLKLAATDQILTTIPQVMNQFRKRKEASLEHPDAFGLST